MEETTLKPYKLFWDLAEVSIAKPTQIKTLTAKQSALQADKERLSKAKAGIGQSMIADHGEGNGRGALFGKLESVDREEKVTDAQSEAVTVCRAEAVVELREWLPQACQTTYRLWQPMRVRAFELAVAAITDLIHPNFRVAKAAEIQSLAGWTTIVVDTPPAPPSAIDPRFATPEAVLTIAEKLSEALPAIIEQCELLELTPPEFVLGALPEPPESLGSPIASTPQLPELGELEPGELAFVWEMCRSAGRTLETLTDNDKMVLAVSLENHRKSRFLIPNVTTYSIKTTRSDPQIEALRAAGKL